MNAHVLYGMGAECTPGLACLGRSMRRTASATAEPKADSHALPWQAAWAGPEPGIPATEP
jgi:hypothetical protein